MKNLSENRADQFMWMAVFTLILNCVSQELAFPVQIVLLIYGVTRCDVRYLPAMLVLLLDKGFFTVFKTAMLRFNIGISVTTDIVLIIVMFFVALWGLNRHWYDCKTKMLIWLWLPTFIPALLTSFQARSMGLQGVWSDPAMKALAPSLYFWGVRVGKTWEEGKEYFVKRMIEVYFCLSLLWMLRQLMFFQFHIHITMICLLFVARYVRLSMFHKVLVFVGAPIALVNVVLGRYIEQVMDEGAATQSELGSSFTTVAIFALGVLFAKNLGKTFKGATMRIIPYVAAIAASCVFYYAVVRFGKGDMSADTGAFKYNTLIERFEWKLFGDRGAVWSIGWEEVFDPPYIIKDLRKFIVFDAVYNEVTKSFQNGLKIMSHNQVCMLIGRLGWWQGGAMVLFLWFICLRAFNCGSRMPNDFIVNNLLLAVFAGIYFPLGLTGQGVFTGNFLGNGMSTMVFPGMIYGIYSQRQKQLRMRGWGGAYSMV